MIKNRKIKIVILFIKIILLEDINFYKKLLLIQ